MFHLNIVYDNFHISDDILSNCNIIGL